MTLLCSEITCGLRRGARDFPLPSKILVKKGRPYVGRKSMAHFVPCRGDTAFRHEASPGLGTRLATSETTKAPEAISLPPPPPALHPNPVPRSLGKDSINKYIQ